VSAGENNARPDRVRPPAGSQRGRLASAGLHALSVAYSGALHLHLFGYRAGIARRTHLPATVISIGNLTVGGTGKTTATIAVARWLWERGRRVGVLSRGYRGRAERQGLVVSEGFGPLVDVETAGDEPYMIAHQLPNVYVLVGKDRRRTGRLAVGKYGLNALVLDDGFQYQRLHRDVDIVLVDALRPFGYDLTADADRLPDRSSCAEACPTSGTRGLVPSGLLREPPEHLERAHAVWLTHCDLVRGEDLEQVRSWVVSLAPQARVWEVVHEPVRLRRLATSDVVELSEVRGRRLCAVSALGNPLAFERTLTKLGADLVCHARFPDHHRYTKEELAEVVTSAGGEAEWVVTTAKDAVRLPQDSLGKPVWVLEVELASHTEESNLGEEMSCLLGATERT